MQANKKAGRVLITARPRRERPPATGWRGVTGWPPLLNQL